MTSVKGSNDEKGGKCSRNTLQAAKIQYSDYAVLLHAIANALNTDLIKN